MPTGPDIRQIVREELRDLCDDLDIGQPGSDRRRDFLAAVQFANDERKRIVAKKERRNAGLAGIFYGTVLGSVASAAVAWGLGLWQGFLAWATTR